MTIRVCDLAKQIGSTSKEVVAKANELGITAKAANSPLSEENAKIIAEAFGSSNSTPTVVKEDKKETKKKEPAKASADSPVKRRLVGTPMTKAQKAERDAKIAKEKEAILAEAAKKEAEKKEAEAAETQAVETLVVETAKETVEAPKAAEKAETKEPEKKEEPVFRGPKVIKRAEDVQKEEEERLAAAAAKAEEKAKKEKEAKKAAAEKKAAERKASDDKKAARNKQRNEKSDREKPNRERSEKKEFSSREKFTAEAPVNPEKADTRKSRKKDKDKDRDRDDFDTRSRKERRGKNTESNQYGENSLEKKARKKKKQQKVKPEAEVEVEMEDMPVGTKVINVPITVAGYCEQVGVSVSNVIMTLMKLGIVSNINANLDGETAMILSEELGLNVVIGNVEEEDVDEGLELFEDKEEDLVGRPPIITVMGHVDHGKTSLLDAIRATNVTAKESGGITQHIGASEVKLNGQRIVFLDTPGHEAFTAMRARGADITDIAVLVVAADDSVKPQTVESISHAKAAGVPIIVAINKMDKPGANPDAVKKDLTEHGILVEDWGGDVISVPVSAKKGDGIEDLLEMILLQAEVLELKANPNRLGMGTVIEARLDKSKGPVATLLVNNGTVKSGQSLVAGNTSGKIRLMTDYKGKTIKKAGPATAIEILGLNEVPAPGDDFHIVESDKKAREIAEKRKQKLRDEVLAKNSSSTLEELFSKIQAGEVKDLNLIVKGDVNGSVGAIVASLEKLSNEDVRVRIVHQGVGAINESDVTLANTAGAIIVGFNVRPSNGVQTIADREGVQIRTYRVIYDIIDDVENAMKGMLDPEFKEVVLGQCEIRDTFKVPGVGTIGGAYVTSGKLVRNAEVRIVRDGIVIHEGKISSLKRFKDDAREVNTGYECGIGIENYNDIKLGDVIECFQMEEVERK